MKKKVIIYLIVLLVIPISLSIFFGLTKPKNTEKDIVLYEANSAEKVDINSIDGNLSYIVLFSSLAIMGTLYLYIAKRKE